MDSELPTERSQRKNIANIRFSHGLHTAAQAPANLVLTTRQKEFAHARRHPPSWRTHLIELPSGELIEVVVLSLKGNQVKPSTDAPKHLPVVPKELLEGAADQLVAKLFPTTQ